MQFLRKVFPAVAVVALWSALAFGGGTPLNNIDPSTNVYTAAQADAAFQPLDADLTALAGVTSAADKMPYFTGAGSASVTTFTSFMRTLLDDTDQATARSTLGLGTAATSASGDFAAASHSHSASDITSGSLDGDRLPGLSTTKRGGVKATGTPSGLFLRDDDTWATPSGAAAWVSTVTTKTADYTITSSDDGTYFVGLTIGGAIIFTLPTSPSSGFRVAIQKRGSGANSLTVTCGGSDGIKASRSGNVTSLTLQTFEALTLIYTGNNEWIAMASSPLADQAAAVASLRSLGTSSTTAAAGNDSRITGAVQNGGALGTPSSGTLTNCGSLPLSGVTDSTSEALGAGSIELGHASDTTIARSGAGAITVEGVDVALNSTSLAHTASTIELGAASDTTLARSSAGVITVEGATVYTSGNVPGFGTGFMCTPGLHAANLTAVTAFASNSCYCFYLGRAFKANPTFDVRVNVTTGAATITWAEVGIATGTPAVGGNPALTTRGYTSVSGTFNGTGAKTTTVTTTNVAIGADIWVLLGSQATTPYQVRGMLADNLQTGVFAIATTTRPSTMGAGTSFTLAGGTVVPAWVVARQY
jgi:hypothetical protein